MVIIIAIINKISDRKDEPFSSGITNNAPVFEPAASYNKLNANKQIYTYMCMYDDLKNRSCMWGNCGTEAPHRITT